MKRSGERGAALAEFALTVPLIALLIGGMAEYGRFLYDASEVGNAAGAGAQYGSQNLLTAADTLPGGGIELAAEADAAQIPSLGVTSSTSCACNASPATTFACTTTIAVAPCSASPSDFRVITVSVTASATFVPLIRLPGIPASLTISRTAVEEVNP